MAMIPQRSPSVHTSMLSSNEENSISSLERSPTTASDVGLSHGCSHVSPAAEGVSATVPFYRYAELADMMYYANPLVALHLYLSGSTRHQLTFYHPS
jgi:hypothetical protein